MLTVSDTLWLLYELFSLSFLETEGRPGNLQGRDVAAASGVPGHPHRGFSGQLGHSALLVPRAKGASAKEVKAAVMALRKTESSKQSIEKHFWKKLYL